MRPIQERPSDRPGSPGSAPGEAPLPPAPGPSVRPGRVYFILLAIYFGMVVYGSLVPLQFRSMPLDDAFEKFRQIRYLRLEIGSRSDLVANFLLFVPLTFLTMGAFTRKSRRWVKPLIAVVLAAAATSLSVAIEFTQLFFQPRTVSQNDILAETVGGIAGILLWFFFGGRITRWARGLWRERTSGRLAVKILSGYVVFLILYQAFPFDMTISPVEVYRKLKGPKVTVLPFCDAVGVDAYTAVSKVAVMIPIGFLLVLLQSRRRGRIFRAGVLACIFAVLIESAQLFVYSRYSSSTDVLFGAVGGLLGALAALLFGPAARRPTLETPFWRRHGLWIKLPATAAWLGGMAWEKWRPFDFAWPREGLATAAKDVLAVPFERQYFSTEFLAASQVVREFTTFFFLAMLLRSLLAPAGRAGKVGCALLVVALAVAYEFGQVFLPTRTADLTAMAISGAGGVMGVWLFEGFVNVFLKTGRVGADNAQSGGQ